MPFEDPIPDPTEQIHVAYHEALGRFANGWIAPGQDGDPPNAFVTQDDVVLSADLLAGAYDLDSLIVPPFTVHQFIFRGAAAAVLSDYPDVIPNREQVVAAVASAKVAPTTTDLTLNFQYEGVDVLSTPLHIPVGAPAGQRQYSTAVGLAQLVPPNFLDFSGYLFARIVSVDGGATAANISAALITQRVPA